MFTVEISLHGVLASTVLASAIAIVSKSSELQVPEDEVPVWFWADGTTPITIDHLTWAVWIITSRVLTVQTGIANDEI